MSILALGVMPYISAYYYAAVIGYGSSARAA